ncbi:hypothetical protein GUITHDRAFT_151643 [Guillardia theta CCMP2712]|uniref:Uncharacterized protein n=1 Tax=Guillardia theta (strain CCMP2712) TaxID=905079 RepID=L1JL20_GUITC|nr:hypothetical protein GUITHDRAFT_151643 [Guillardia theta CCMP2712]EKX49203.1 hypothetical protein GUITHDRAFT_151643 [Guillardia theta CCMP2712]|eukprot:XP_005836183.1 hypothetical protein GUITHDRAFT_151643 [Guillardia theta CCMP2712]
MSVYVAIANLYKSMCYKFLPIPSVKVTSRGAGKAKVHIILQAEPGRKKFMKVDGLHH